MMIGAKLVRCRLENKELPVEKEVSSDLARLFLKELKWNTA